tara:strand:- start:247 stop:1617 length:1371 start_codon:yes stop_codon:yes gene_type:complete
MAITDTQKVDFLWKKIAFSKAKTDTNANKKGPNEPNPSPLLIRGDKVWRQSSEIAAAIPAVNTEYVGVHTSGSPRELVADETSTTNRTWKSNLTDWIPPELGSTYQVKVYIHTASDAANAVASGTQVFETGSGNNDEWYYDYSAGILHFIGTNLPNGVNFTGKSVYITGARYIGAFGIPGAVDSGGGNTYAGVSTFTDTTNNTLGDEDTGALQIDGGVGIAKNLTVAENLYVGGYSEFVGVVTFKGGTVRLGDGNTDNINVGGEFTSNLVPNADATYNLGISTQKWRDGLFSNDVVASAVKTGIISATDGKSGLTIADVTGDVGISSNLTVNGNLFITGSQTQVNTNTLTVEDSLVELGLVDGSAPSSDLNVDLGLILNYYTSEAKKAAIFWDDSTRRVAIGSDVSETSSVISPSIYGALEIGQLWVNDCAGQSQVISCTGTERFLENITIDAGTF